MSDDQPVVVLLGFARSSRLERHLLPLNSSAEVRISDALTPDDVARAIADAHVVVTRGTVLNEPALSGARYLRGIVINGIGVDFVDLETAHRLGIPVANTPVFARSVAEGTLLILMAVARRYNELDRIVRSGRRPDSNFRGVEIFGKTLGLIGMGRVATELVHLMCGFDMEVLAYDPVLPPEAISERGANAATMEAVLRESDFVCVLCPLIDSTYHLIGEAQFALMRETAFLVNTARGPIVDEGALFHALEAGELAGAAIDVFESEPPNVDNPLLHMDNVVAWPHRAPATWETYDRVSEAVVRAAQAFLDGETPEFPVVGSY